MEDSGGERREGRTPYSLQNWCTDEDGRPRERGSFGSVVMLRSAVDVYFNLSGNVVSPRPVSEGTNMEGDRHSDLGSFWIGLLLI